MNTSNHQCSQCDFKAINDQTLMRHTAVVHGVAKTGQIVNGHLCPQCGFSASSEGILKNHVNIIHLKMKYHRCDQCTFAAYSEATLLKHIRCVHDKIDGYRCEHCDFATRQKANLERHVKSVHFKIRIKCLQCDYTASTHDTLKNHAQKAHGDIFIQDGINPNDVYEQPVPVDDLIFDAPGLVLPADQELCSNTDQGQEFLVVKGPEEEFSDMKVIGIS